MADDQRSDPASSIFRFPESLNGAVRQNRRHTRATMKIGRADLTYNIIRCVWHEKGRQRPAVTVFGRSIRAGSFDPISFRLTFSPPCNELDTPVYKSIQ
jgi:hypothetical protein